MNDAYPLDDVDGEPDESVGRRTFLTSAMLGSAGLVVGVNMFGPSLFGSGAPEAAAAPPAQPLGPGAPNFGLTKFLDPLRIPPVLRPQQDLITVRMTNARVKLHSQLPETALWTFEGSFPGPTIEVRSGKRTRVAWSNELTGKIPLVAARVPFAKPSPAYTPGYRNPDGSLPSGVSLYDGVADIPPWNVVHLHGAVTAAHNDGWAHNGVPTGDAQLTEYPNRQAATSLWYHDHAMAVTRFTVYSGLAGMYLIRDAEEDAAGLPRGEREIPLIISDRNLDTDPATGALTGQLLYKLPYVPASGTTAPVTGPFQLVNGVIWPHLDVTGDLYRFRVLNAANSRFFRLDLIDEAGVLHNDAIKIAGTDAGLLPAPVAMPAGGLTISPAERVDLLVDFSKFPGQRLRLSNTGSVGEPDIMEFRVASRARAVVVPPKLSKSYVRLAPGTTVPADHDEVYVALLPGTVAGEPDPTMWELREITDPAELPAVFPATGIIQLTDPATGNVRSFKKVAGLFDDTRTIFINRGRWAVWHFLQLGGSPHPMHIHMTRLQLLSRTTWTDLTAFNVPVGGTSRPLPAPNAGPAIEKWEEGWKDTFQARQGEWITVAGQFDGASGEFMYHCHILEHEDMGMMRPFVVHPPEIARFHMHPHIDVHSGQPMTGHSGH
ncbi:multicopper oxidase family protein [Amycolatopsis vancoresmycina]|uniref:multicopper oxidase family protein n=2 Tax=Amycolatopsis vancoresmycina TaxID=208444 RepID=UPI000B07B6E0|nr:multicopper oxidase domain-containing protein [Amycolatopsis vancoresmycina]